MIKPDSDVNDEQLATAFNMVEMVLNSWPLTYVGSDLNDLEPLTPEHFLGKTQVTAQGTTQMTEDMHIDFDRHFKSFHKTFVPCGDLVRKRICTWFAALREMEKENGKFGRRSNHYSL